MGTETKSEGRPSTGEQIYIRNVDLKRLKALARDGNRQIPDQLGVLILEGCIASGMDPETLKRIL